MDDQKVNHIVLKKQIINKLKDYFTKDLNVFSAYSGEECLEFLNNNKPNIIIMDEIMKENGLLGSETVMKIRENGNNDVIIIHSSGNSEKLDRIRYWNCGINQNWGKPIPYKEIK